MITVFGTVALDTTRTPFKTVTDVLGGAATFASLSASFFGKTGIVGVVGNDFPQNYLKVLSDRIDVRGLKIGDGRTFRYDSSFEYDMNKRVTNKTELNVIENFNPQVPEEYRKSEYVYLGNNDPAQNLKLLEQFDNTKLTMCDTIEYWILNKRDEIIKMISSVNGVVLNEDEARLLCKTPSLVKCGRMILNHGPDFAVIKKGEHGALFFFEDVVFPAPGYPLEDVVDPTGAGDAFAGGFMGHVARTGSTSLNVLKEAVVYGNVMGSFAVEDFGVGRFLNLSIQEIEERYQRYKGFVKF